MGSGLILLSAFLIRYALQPLIEPYAPYHFFIVACLFIACFYGYKFAFISTFISAFLGSFFFVKPYYSFDIATVSDMIQFCNFAVVTTISVFIIESLQRTLYARRMVLKIMQSRYRISLFRENDRIYFSKKQSEAWSILEEILTDFDDILFLKFAGGNVKLEPLFLALAGTDQFLLPDDAWQTLIDPKDLPELLSNLEHAALKPGLVRVFDLRFANNPKGNSYKVQLESYEFMGKPLKLLRLSAD